MSTQEEQEEGIGEGCLSVGDREWGREEIWNNRGIQCMHTCKLCACVCARMYTVHVCVHMYVRACARACECVCVCVCVCVPVCLLSLTQSIHPKSDIFFNLAGW